jgi:hypothetical protein
MRNFTSRIASPRSLNTVPRSSRSFTWLRLLLLVEELSVAGELDPDEVAGSWAEDASTHAIIVARTMIHRRRCITFLPECSDVLRRARDATASAAPRLLTLRRALPLLRPRQAGRRFRLPQLSPHPRRPRHLPRHRRK